MMPREQLIETAKRVYRSYGFSPIDTPALEYLEVLTGKGSDETDRQLYKFTDHGGRDVGMRFDLTVPLARFAAQHASKLGLPFKRYHIAKVWRGENTQRGRYREFMQCDFDTIGTKSVVADIETALVIHDLFVQLGFSDFTIRANNRQVLNGLLEKLGLLDQSVAWKVFDFHDDHPPNETAIPEFDRPPKIDDIWHNAFHHLIKNKEPKIMITALDAMSALREERLFRILDSYIKGVSVHDYVPSPGIHCSFCQYRNECRRWH